VVPIGDVQTHGDVQTRITSSIIGGIIVVVTGLTQLEKYQENRILYRTGAEINSAKPEGAKTNPEINSEAPVTSTVVCLLTSLVITITPPAKANADSIGHRKWQNNTQI